MIVFLINNSIHYFLFLLAKNKQTNKQTKKAKYSYTNADQYKIMINNSFIFACLSFTL